MAACILLLVGMRGLFFEGVGVFPPGMWWSWILSAISVVRADAHRPSWRCQSGFVPAERVFHLIHAFAPQRGLLWCLHVTGTSTSVQDSLHISRASSSPPWTWSISCYNRWRRHFFNGHFPIHPGWAGTRMSPFWILLGLRVMTAVVTTGAIRRAKLQSYHHHQQTNT